MEQLPRADKAVGSSNEQRQSSTSASARRQSSVEQPQNISTHTNQPQAHSRQPSEQSSTPSRRTSSQLQVRSRIPSAGQKAKGKSSSDNNSKIADIDDSSSDHEWDLCQPTGQSTTTQTPPPSYEFNGTWSAALIDTTSALTQVSTATASYATALTHSGIAKASWSIGSALASSANRSALSLASWAADRTGTAPEQLPRPIGAWLGNEKARQDEARRRMRKVRRGRQGTGANEPRTFGDERGTFVLETAEMDSTGEIVGPMRPVYMGRGRENGAGWTVAAVRGVQSPYNETVERDEEEDDDDQEDDSVGDGLLRVFEFDD